MIRREPRQESDRIGIHKCTWKYHSEFVNDLRRVGVDGQAWSGIKQMLKSAADGTARDDINWEYPCASSNGIIGELKYDQECDVTYLVADVGKVVDSTTVCYRIYFNEPALCPQELWAMGIGAKSLHPHYVGTDQQVDIEVAKLRASQTSSMGSDLHDLKL